MVRSKTTKSPSRSPSHSKQQTKSPSRSPANTRSQSSKSPARKSLPEKSYRKKSPAKKRSRSSSRTRSKSPARKKSPKERPNVEKPSKDLSESSVEEKVEAHSVVESSTSEVFKKDLEEESSFDRPYNTRSKRIVTKTTTIVEEKQKSTVSSKCVCSFGFRDVCQTVIEFCSIAFIVLTTIGGTYSYYFATRSDRTPLWRKFTHFDTRLYRYVDRDALLVYTTFFLLQASFYALPLTQPVRGPAKLLYSTNGLLAFILSCITFIGFQYFGFSTDYGCRHQLQLITASGIFCFLILAGVFVKHLFRRTTLKSAASQSRLGAFFNGEELHPRIGFFDIKMFTTYRIGQMATMLMYFSYLAESYKRQPNQINYPLLCAATFQMLYTMTVMILESGLPFSSLNKSETICFNRLWHYLVIMPFIQTHIGRFLLLNKITLSWYCTASCWIPFLGGLFIFYYSNNIKNTFKRDPNSSSLGHLVSIRVSNGHLICSGIWGTVRHPNYLGDLLVNVSFLLLCGSPTVINSLPFVYLLLLSFMRIYLVERMLKTKYGSNWTYYTENVPKKLISRLI